MTGESGAIALAERVLAVLDEGTFSATYKFALFTAILDVCIERTSRHGLPPTVITTRQLAARVLELYWNHSVPYGAQGVLRQGGTVAGGQAEIVRRIERTRARWASSQTDTLFRARLDHRDEFSRLLAFTEWKLIEMPIPRLQVLGRREDRFLSSTTGRRRSGGPPCRSTSAAAHRALTTACCSAQASRRTSCGSMGSCAPSFTGSGHSWSRA